MIQAGTTVGRYRLRRRLGRGAVGEVWRADVDGSPVPLALKLVGVADRVRRTALLTELRAASRLDHPHVLQILDYGEVPALDGVQGPVAYLASELCSGTLRDLERPDWPTIRALVVQLLRGLAHAHSRGVVHRDLKPANVLCRLDARGRSWRIADLGIADLGRALVDGRTSGSTGTPLYMAPEQVEGRGRDQGPWTDLYALGCMIHELVGPGHPLAGLGRPEILARQRVGAIPPLEPSLPVPEALAGWVARLLCPDHEERFQRAADALAAWARFDRADPPLDEKRAPGVSLSLVPFRRPTLAGRDAELSALLALGRGDGLRVALLIGAAGCGKSQLARTVCERLHEEDGASTLWATWSEAGGPLDGLAAMIERDVRGRDLPADELLVRLGRRLAPDDAREVAALLRPEAELGVRLVGPAERYAAVRRYLAAEAVHRPLVLWFDDLQWGSEGLELVAVLQGLPILVLGTVREEALPARPVEAQLLEAAEALRIRLGPLGADDLDTLVGSLVGLSPRSLGLLAERVGGNPLFAVQVLTDWAARGVLAAGPDGFEVVVGAALPTDLHASWASRLAEALGGADPRALELAAVLGLRVAPAEWDAACRAAGVTDRESLEEIALRSGLLSREPGGGGVFVHGMLREVLRQQARDHGRLPALAAACAEAVGDGDPLRFGRFLADTEEPARALAHLRRGAILLAQHGRTREVPAVYAEHEAVRPPRDLRSLAEIQVIEARFRITRGDLGRAEELAAGAEQAATEHGWDDVLADVRCAQAVIHRTRGRRARSAACATDARDRFQRVGDPVGVARATALLADVEDDPVIAASLAEQALQALRDRGVAAGALYANLLLRLANTRRGLGQRDDAERFYQQARVLYAELGDRAMLGQTVTALGGIWLERGDFEAARGALDEALGLLSRVDAPRAVAMVQGFGAELAFVTRDDARAEVFARAVADATHASGVRNRFYGEIVLAALRIRAGRPAEGRALVDRVRRLAGDEPAPDLHRMIGALELSLAESVGEYGEALARVLAGGARSPFLDELLALGAVHARAMGW